MKSQKNFDLGVWGLETKFGPLWAQKMYQAVSPEPLLQFSQKGPPSFQDHKTNPVES